MSGVNPGRVAVNTRYSSWPAARWDSERDIDPLLRCGDAVAATGARAPVPPAKTRQFRVIGSGIAVPSGRPWSGNRAHDCPGLSSLADTRREFLMHAQSESMETMVVHGGERRPGPEGSVVYPIYQGTVYSVEPGTGYHDIPYLRLSSAPSQRYL